MEKNEITLSFDGERMRALTIYLKMENTTVQEKMDEAMRQLYEKSVPEPVREYLDIISAPAARPKRPPRPSQPKAPAPKQTPTPTDHGEEDTLNTGLYLDFYPQFRLHIAFDGPLISGSLKEKII